MFDTLQPAKKRRLFAFVASVAVHAAVFAALLYKPEPPLLRPTGSLHGNGGGSTVTHLYVPGASVVAQEKAKPAETKHSQLPALRSKPTPEPEPQVAATQPGVRPGMPGYVLGSLTTGFANDHDVKIALPVFYPDPPVVRAKLPNWISGDVIVEVTIDENGAVTQTRVLQTVGYGLEKTIESTLRNWRWVPAKVDGIAVASRQDVHFHFPS
jgi:TonB family protein